MYDLNGADLNGHCIVTLTDEFPCKVQTWMINHLTQLQDLGGENKIICYFSDDYDFSEQLQAYDLERKAICLGNTIRQMVSTSFKRNSSPALLAKSLRLLLKKEQENKLKKAIFQWINAHALCEQASLIHTHSEAMGYRFLKLVRANGAPLVHTFHGQPPIGVPSITVQQRREFVAATSAIFVNTNFAKNQYTDLGGEEGRYFVIPQGIDTSLWRYSPTLPAEGEPLQLLTVGRLVTEKGHAYVIDAVAELLKQGQRIHYHIVGRGPEETRLRQQVAKLGITDNVTIHGALINEPLKALYRSCHIFILPSLSGNGETWEETQGVVIQEAQASGLIVVGTKTGGIPECIDDAHNGFLIPDRNSDALVQVVHQIMDNMDSWKKWHENGKTHVEKTYHVSVIGKRFAQAYRQILKNVSV